MTSYQPCVPVTLSQVSPERRSKVWDGYEANSWWWCKQCERVTTAAAIQILTFQGADELACPFCEAPGDYLYWYHGWPSRVLKGWQPRPTQGNTYPLPEDWRREGSLLFGRSRSRRRRRSLAVSIS